MGCGRFESVRGSGSGREACKGGGCLVFRQLVGQRPGLEAAAFGIAIEAWNGPDDAK